MSSPKMHCFNGRIDYETFEKHARKFSVISESLFDTWSLQQHDDQVYLVKHEKTRQNPNYKIEYHIVYSVAYSVPVLYFRIFRETGEIIWKEIPETVISWGKLSADESGRGLTQMPHPFFQTPFFQLHPCHTAEWMRDLMENGKNENFNYIVAWLSFIAPHVGLYISEKYCSYNGT